MKIENITEIYDNKGTRATIMNKIYKIQLTAAFSELPGAPGYDIVQGFVIVARGFREVRRIANRNGADELRYDLVTHEGRGFGFNNNIWKNREYALITELGVANDDTPGGIIMTDFRAG